MAGDRLPLQGRGWRDLSAVWVLIAEAGRRRAHALLPRLSKFRSSSTPPVPTDRLPGTRRQRQHSRQSDPGAGFVGKEDRPPPCDRLYPPAEFLLRADHHHVPGGGLTAEGEPVGDQRGADPPPLPGETRGRGYKPRQFRRV